MIQENDGSAVSEKRNRARDFRQRPSIPIGESWSKQSELEADALFDLIEQQPSFRKSRLPKKRDEFRAVFHSLKQAAYMTNGCVRYPRGHGKIDTTMLQIIACVAEAQLARRVDGVRCGDNQSRLIPTGPTWKGVASDPKIFDPHMGSNFVKLFKDRNTKEPIAVPADDSVASEAQRMLEQINAVNSTFAITYQPYNVWDENFDFERALIPIQHIYYTIDTSKHGRIYTPGHYGHQSLPKIERATIRFNGEPCVELDFSGYHARMIYHGLGIDYADDPYSIWPETTKPQRYLVKTLLNAAFNADSKIEAIQGCLFAAKLRTENGKLKSGRKLNKARNLCEALRATKLTFESIWEKMAAHHPQLVPFFGKDMGFLKLMPADGRIALSVMHELTGKGIPCLGVHDSFIVPARHEAELHEAMVRGYQQELQTSFVPKIELNNARQPVETHKHCNVPCNNPSPSIQTIVAGDNARVSVSH